MYARSGLSVVALMLSCSHALVGVDELRLERVHGHSRLVDEPASLLRRCTDCTEGAISSPALFVRFAALIPAWSLTPAATVCVGRPKYTLFATSL